MRLAWLFLLTLSSLCYGQHADFDPIHFKKADSIAYAQKGASLENMPLLTHALTNALPTEVAKFRAIYTWVCTNIKNDYSSYLRTKKKRKKATKNRAAFLEWNAAYTPKVFKRLVTDKKTACTGYAYLIKEMAHLAGLQSEIINGYGRTPTLSLNDASVPNHSWNAVLLNNKWYLCDATWSAGRILITEDKPTFEPDYFEGYFLAEPAFFARNHYPLDKKWLLLSNEYSFDDFIQAPLVYKAAFANALLPIAPNKMHVNIAKNEVVDFSLKTTAAVSDKKIILQLVRGGTAEEVYPKISTSKNMLSFKQQFDKKGRFDVHIRLDDAIIATYVVLIK